MAKWDIRIEPVGNLWWGEISCAYEYSAHIMDSNPERCRDRLLELKRKYMRAYKNFAVLLGRILKKIEVSDNEIHFYTNTGIHFRMYHEQDCCEAVWIEDIDGNIFDLIGKEITLAEEVSNADFPPLSDYDDESYTWTFYKLGTMYDTVTIRWYGTSNGYYSESADFEYVED